MKRHWLACLVSLWLLAPVGAEPSVQRAPEYDALFTRRVGWTGADGTYSLRVGESTVWLFSDTFWGEVRPDRSRSTDSLFLHNSLAVQRQGQLQFYPQPFHPPDGTGWFWLLDGYADGPDRFQVFLGQFQSIPGAEGWNFAACGNSLAHVVLTPDGPRVSSYTRIPFFVAGPPVTEFGAGVLIEGDWAYLYGTRDYQTHKTLVLARCPQRNPADFGAWRFWNGRDWGTDPATCADLANPVSNELSVHRQGDEYWLVAGHEARILLYRAPHPWGPFGTGQCLWTAPEQTDGVIVYNPKAHPELSGRRLLISYNVNAMPPQRVMQDADLYRPRFLWVTP